MLTSPVRAVKHWRSSETRFRWDSGSGYGRDEAKSCALAAVLAGFWLSSPALAQHACDDLGERGWKTVATVETVAQKDGTPYRAEPAGSWYVDRSTTLLPFCNYYNSLGNYSLRSYSLSPETRTERVEICRARRCRFTLCRALPTGLGCRVPTSSIQRADLPLIYYSSAMGRS